MSVSSPAFPQSAPFAGRRQFVRQALAVSSAARFSGRIRANGSEGGGGMSTTEDPWQTSTSGSTTTDDTSVEVSTTDWWETTVVSTTQPPGPVVRSGPAENKDYHVEVGGEANNIEFGGKTYGLKLRGNPEPSGVHPTSLTFGLTVEWWEVGSNQGVSSTSAVTLTGSLNSSGAFSAASAPENHLKGYNFDVPNSGVIAGYEHGQINNKNTRYWRRLKVTAEVAEDDATDVERELEIHLYVQVWGYLQNRDDETSPWQDPVNTQPTCIGALGVRTIKVTVFKDS